jgi:hypothetical protein
VAWPWNFDEEEVEVWSNDLARPTIWKKTDEFVEKGITLWRFDLAAEEWQSSAQNPANDLYYQEIEGLMNITSVLGRFG